MQRKDGGFTLIELVVVMVIIGILSVIAVPMYQGYVKRAMASEGRALVGGVATAERVYYAEAGVYLVVNPAVDVNTTLAIDCRQNTYFRSFSVSSTDVAANFTVSTDGSGNANGINVQLAQTQTAAPTVTVTGI